MHVSTVSLLKSFLCIVFVLCGRTKQVCLFILEDAMLDALSEKVAKVHRSCVDDRMTNLSTFEKVANIENCMLSLLEGLESIPGETLESMRKIKESEKRTRWVLTAALLIFTTVTRVSLQRCVADSARKSWGNRKKNRKKGWRDTWKDLFPTQRKRCVSLF